MIFDIATSCCFWSVPAFIVLSGYHTVPALSSTSTAAYCKRRVGGVLGQTLFWSVLYSTMSLGAVGADAVLRAWLHCRPFFHLWFVFMLLGLYLLAPLCWRIAKGKMGVAVTLCFAILVTLRPEMWDSDLWQCPLLISIPYVPMFVAGGLLAERKITPTIGNCAVALAAAYFAFMAWASANGFGNAVYPFCHYLGFAGLWGGVSVTVAFVYLGRFLSPSASVLFFRVSRLVFGVYLVHPLVMTAFQKVVPNVFYGSVLVRIAIWCGVCAASFTLAALMHQVKGRIMGLPEGVLTFAGSRKSKAKSQ